MKKVWFDEAWERMRMSNNFTVRNKMVGVLLLCLIFIMFVGCSQEVKEPIKVDTLAVAQFADEEMEKKDCTIIERVISQRTNNEMLFVVEYLYKVDETEKTYKYGYYLKAENDTFSIIDEGENVNKSSLE